MPRAPFESVSAQIQSAASRFARRSITKGTRALLLRALSERECARFRNRNFRQPGRQRRVHVVEFREWIGGLKLPMPACHQPIDSLALVGRSEAVRAPVDCVRCLAYDEGHPTLLTVVDGGGQLALDLDEDDAE